MATGYPLLGEIRRKSVKDFALILRQNIGNI